MATIKSYTDIKQSRKLAEILPIESADMYFREWKRMTKDIRIAYVGSAGEKDLPCWSIAALFDVLPKEAEIEGQVYAPCLFIVQDKCILKLWYNSNHTITSPIAIFSDNIVDACYEMILKLNELNLL